MILKELILTVSTLGGYSHLERTDFFTVSPLRGCGGLEKELILNSFYFGRVWWS